MQVEHEPTGVRLLDADGQLVREAADGPAGTQPERDVRIFFRAQTRRLRAVEKRSFVRLGTQPPAALIAQHGVQNHHPLDHAADRLQTAIAVVRLPDSLVQRLVVNVVETPAPHGSWLDGSRESAGDQAGDKFAAVLATRRPAECAVLPFQEDQEWSITVTRNSRCRCVRPKSARPIPGGY